MLLPLYLVSHMNITASSVSVSSTDLARQRVRQPHGEEEERGGDGKRGQGERQPQQEQSTHQTLACLPFHSSSPCFSPAGRSQGSGSPLEHPGLVAKHDVWRRRRRPVDAQPGNPQQIPPWHGHIKLYAFQPSVHPKGSVLSSTYLGWLKYAIFTNTVLLSTSFGAISRWC